MKTAEEILISEFRAGNCDDITTNPDPDFNLPFYQDIVSLMKIYGRKCYKQALKDASEKVAKEFRYPVDGPHCEAILSTPSQIK